MVTCKLKRELPYGDLYQPDDYGSGGAMFNGGTGTKCLRESSGSVVECLTQDREVAGSSLTGVTALWSLSKTHFSYLSTGSTQEDPSLFN